MEILICSIQIVMLDLLILLEVFFAFKVFFIFRKNIASVDQQDIKSREYSKISAISLLVEIIGTFSSLALFQRLISNFVLDMITYIVLVGVFLISIIHRVVYLKRLVEEDVYENVISPAKVVISDGFKALFICGLINFTIQNYIYIMQISPVMAAVLLVLTIIVFVVVIPKLYRIVKNRPYPET